VNSLGALARFALVVLTLCSAGRALAAVEFAGVLITSEKSLFRLKDDSSGASPAWVKVGDTFAGHEILSFDAQRDTLTLRKDGATSAVRLKDSKVRPEASIEISGVATFGGDEKMEVSRATLLMDQENSFPLKQGIICLITPTRLTDGSIRYRLVFERPDADGDIELLSVLTLTQRAGDPLSFQFASEKNTAATATPARSPQRNPPTTPLENPPRESPLQKTKP
jgi:hypothetical protein